MKQNKTKWILTSALVAVGAAFVAGVARELRTIKKLTVDADPAEPTDPVVTPAPEAETCTDDPADEKPAEETEA